MVKKIIFDFDNTLFDTELLKQTMRESAIAAGCTPEEARIVYERARTDSEGNITICLDQFIKTLRDFLSQRGSIFSAEAETRLRQWLQERGSTLVFSGVREMLAKSNELAECYLLSLGIPVWQEEKIALAGIAKYFSPGHIVFTDRDGGKTAALQELFGDAFDGTDAVLFNDRPEESAELLAAYPKLRVFIRRDRRDMRYQREEQWQDIQKKFSDRVVIADDIVELFRQFSLSYL